MYKKRYTVADAAAAFQHTVSFAAPSIFHFRHEGAWQQAADGRGLAPRSKDKLIARSIHNALGISHHPTHTTIYLMQSGYTKTEWKGKKGENMSQHRGDSFGAAGGLLGYHSLIAAVAQDAEWPRK